MYTAFSKSKSNFDELYDAALDALIPPGYIDGNRMIYVGPNAITVTSGAAYIPSLGKVLRATSDIAKTGLTLSASTWYHVYLFDNAGAPDIEIVTTAPATPYNGTARTKTGDTSRRYVGTVLSDASGNLYNFQHSGDSIKYNASMNNTSFLILSSGRAIVSTNVSLTSAVPITAKIASLLILNSDLTKIVYFSNTVTGGVSETNFLSLVFSPGTVTVDYPVGTDQRLNYTYPSTPTGACFIRVVGYIYER